MAVRDASAVFPSGGISAIVGPSGCGKTGLVHAIAGLLTPSSGEVLIDGHPVGGVRPRTSVIFQDYGLLPWRTVEGNAELPLTLAGFRQAERRRRVRPLLDELGLSDFRHFYPQRLSGGMKHWPPSLTSC
jgi:NitT/TauT family transport system ATP-binding protein